MRIQALSRSFLITRWYRALRAATVLVQSLARRWFAVREAHRRRQLRASFIITACMRCVMWRQRYTRFRLAIITLQLNLRAHKRRVVFLRDRRLRAAVVVQTQWRGYRARRRFYDALQKVREMARRKVSATHLQAWWRCRQAQAAYKRLRSAMAIQAGWRGHVGRVVARRHRAARRLQAVWRGFSQRRQYLRLRATIRVQAWRRGMCQRRAYHRLLAAVKLQAHWRAWRQQRIYRRLVAAIKLQAWQRGRMQRWWYVRTLAARKLQGLWRGYAYRRFYRTTHAATAIQTCWRRARLRAAYLDFRAGVIRAQCAVRAWLASRTVAALRMEQQWLPRRPTRVTTSMKLRAFERHMRKYKRWLVANQKRLPWTVTTPPPATLVFGATRGGFDDDDDDDDDGNGYSVNPARRLNVWAARCTLVDTLLRAALPQLLPCPYVAACTTHDGHLVLGCSRHAVDVAEWRVRPGTIVVQSRTSFMGPTGRSGAMDVCRTLFRSATLLLFQPRDPLDRDCVSRVCATPAQLLHVVASSLRQPTWPSARFLHNEAASLERAACDALRRAINSHRVLRSARRHAVTARQLAAAALVHLQAWLRWLPRRLRRSTLRHGRVALLDLVRADDTTRCAAVAARLHDLASTAAEAYRSCFHEEIVRSLPATPAWLDSECDAVEARCGAQFRATLPRLTPGVPEKAARQARDRFHECMAAVRAAVVRHNVVALADTRVADEDALARIVDHTASAVDRRASGAGPDVLPALLEEATQRWSTAEAALKADMATRPIRTLDADDVPSGRRRVFASLSAAARMSLSSIETATRRDVHSIALRRVADASAEFQRAVELKSNELEAACDALNLHSADRVVAAVDGIRTECDGFPDALRLQRAKHGAHIKAQLAELPLSQEAQQLLVSQWDTHAVQLAAWAIKVCPA